MQKKQKTTALLINAEYLQVLSRLNDGVAIIMNGKFVYCNKAALKITGYALNQLIGKPVSNFLPYDQKTKLYNNLSRETGSFKTVNEYKIFSGKGEMKYIQVHSTPVNYQDRPAVIGIVRDITGQKQVEQELKETTLEYKITLDALPEAIHVVDNKLRIIFINQQFKKWDKKLGLKTDVIGKSIFEIFPFLPKKKVSSEYSKVFKTGNILITETINQVGQNKIITETRKVPIIEDGNVTKIVTIITDITKHKKVQEELTRALEEYRMREKEISALLHSTQAVLKIREFSKAARVIFDKCKNIIGATAGYVALLSKDGKKNEVLFLEAGGRPCKVDTGLPMPIRGLRAESYKTGKAVYDNNFFKSKWMKYMPKGHVRLDNVLFAPLTVRKKAMGLLGLANKPGGFTDKDARIAELFGELAAVALNNSRILESLEQSNSLHKATLESTDDGLLVVDTGGKITSYNKKFVDMWHIPDKVIKSGDDKEALAFVLAQLKHPDKFIQKVKYLYGRPNQSSYDNIEFKDGRIFERYSKPQSIEGKIAGRVWSFRDVTIRRQAEDALKKSESQQRNLKAYYRSLIDQIDEYIMVIDKDYNVLDINGFYLKKINMKREEVIGKKCYYISHGSLVDCRGQGEDCPLKTVLRTKMSYMSTHKHLGGDGKTYFVNIIASPLLDENGNVKSIVHAMRDITNLMDMSDAVRKSEKRYHDLYDSAPCAYFSVDANGLIRQCNRQAAELTGYTLMELAAKPVFELYPETELGRKKREKILKQSLEGKVIANEELQLLRKDGRIIWVSLNVNPIFDDKGKVAETRTMMIDITEQKLEDKRTESLQEALFHAERLSYVGRLAAELAHQINNPLMIIQGRAELLKMDAVSPKDKEKIETLIEQCQRASKITTALLSLTRRKELKFGHVNINLSVQKIIDVKKEELEQSKIEVKLHFSKDLPEILADRLLLDDAIINLINNAQDAMPDGGRLLIKTDFDNNNIYLEVMDTGIGISEDNKAKIFEHFFTTKEDGTGLGLAIVYNIIKAHKGSIDCESVLGKGTTFKITLPLT